MTTFLTRMELQLIDALPVAHVVFHAVHGGGAENTNDATRS